MLIAPSSQNDKERKMQTRPARRLAMVVRYHSPQKFLLTSIMIVAIPKNDKLSLGFMAF
jgi:hypothetical protein